MNGSISPSEAPMANAFRSTDKDSLSGTAARLIDRRDAAMGPAYRLFYRSPLHPVRGEGVWLYDADGRRYLDMYNNVAVVGHCHPRLLAAIAEQSARLATHTRYLDETIIRYGEALKAKLGPGLDHVMFTCSGSEANDLAVRMARTATGRLGVLVTDHAYHGTTSLTAAMSPALGPGTPSDPAVVRIPAPQCDGTDPSIEAERFRAAVLQGIDTLAARGIGFAVLCIDTVFSSDGLVPGPVGLLAGAVDAARAAGGLLLADEVQAGFGRVGSDFWGFRRHGIEPDIVTMGKPMGGGYPMAGLAARSPVSAAFAKSVRYFNTFAGNPVAAAAGLAVLDIIADDALDARAEDVGNLLHYAIANETASDPLVGAIRRAGMFMAIDIVDPDDPTLPNAGAAAAIVNDLRSRGVLISATGPSENVLKVRPPLVFDVEQISFFIEAFRQSLRT